MNQYIFFNISSYTNTMAMKPSLTDCINGHKREFTYLVI